MSHRLIDVIGVIDVIGEGRFRCPCSDRLSQERSSHMPTYTDRLRRCTVCDSPFQSQYGAEVCSSPCKAARQARYTREYQARRKAELERLRGLVAEIRSLSVA